MSTRYLRDYLALVEGEGITVLKTAHASSGTHVKVHMQYRHVKFFMTTSVARSSDSRAIAKMRADLRNVKRAIDSNDADRLAKYISPHRKPP